MEIVKVFVLLFILEVIWVKCIWTVNGRSPGLAAAWSTAFYVVSTLAVLDVVKQPWLILPAAAGAYAGTYLTVWRGKDG